MSSHRRKSTLARAAVLESLEQRRLFSVTFDANKFLIQPGSDVVESDVSMDSDGDFVVAWRADTNYGSEKGVHAQRFDRTGTPVGADIQVSTDTKARHVHVALADNGDFVVTWTHNVSNTTIFTEGTVMARLFDGSGAARGAEFSASGGLTPSVPGSTSPRETTPDVAIDADGDFVVTWSNNPHIGEQFGKGVYARRFSKTTATPVDAAPFEISGNTTDFDAKRPVVAMDPAGDYVVTWQSRPVAHHYASDQWLVQSKSFKANGTAASDLVTVDSTGGDNQQVDMDASGNYVVSWQNSASNVVTTYAQRYTAGGAPIGTGVQISTDSMSYRASVASMASGAFLLAWRNFSTEDLIVAEYDANGHAIGGPVGVGTSSMRYDSQAQVVTDDLGRGFVAGIQQLPDSNPSEAGWAFTSASTPTKPFLQVAGSGAVLTAGAKPGSLVVKLLDTMGKPMASDKTTLTMTVTKSPAGGKLTGAPGKATAKGGTATFTKLSATKAGTYTVRITGGTYAPLTTTVTVLPAAVSKAAFLKAPASAKHGVPFGGVKVQLFDKYGNVATNATTVVKLTLGVKPAGASALAGVLSAVAANGVATFDGLSLAKAGSYTLVASGKGFAKVTSKPFTVK